MIGSTMWTHSISNIELRIIWYRNITLYTWPFTFGSTGFGSVFPSFTLPNRVFADDMIGGGDAPAATDAITAGPSGDDNGDGKWWRCINDEIEIRGVVSAFGVILGLVGSPKRWNDSSY